MTIKSEFEYKYKKYKEKGIPNEYKLAMSVKGFSIFKVDKLPKKPRGRHCDDFIFFDLMGKNETGIYLIEIKGKVIDTKKVKEQLQGGAGFIEKFLNTDVLEPERKQFDFLPVLVSKGIRRSAISKLKKQKILLDPKWAFIEWIEEGGELPRLSS